jgi:hypothetical protein
LQGLTEIAVDYLGLQAMNLLNIDAVGVKAERTCIYCLEVKPFHKSKKLRTKDWTREHVLHDAFGKFSGENLTLIGRVCGDCNQTFGESIDPVLTLSSFEALNRYKYGVKSLDKLYELDQSYLELKFDCPGDEVWHGVMVEFYDGDGELQSRLANQYAFKDRLTNEWIHLSEDTFHKEDPRVSFPTIDLHGEQYKIVARTSADYDRLIARAYYKGVRFEPKSLIRPPNEDRPLYLSFTVGTQHQQAMAKIAFNYMAKITESISLDLPLDSQFDGLRSFIKTGMNPGWQVVHLSEMPLLATETQTKRLTNGHLVSAEFKRAGRHVQWRANVAIFNHIVFEVVLTQNRSAIHYPIHSCHHWNIEDRTCKKLDGVRRDGLLLGQSKFGQHSNS